MYCTKYCRQTSKWLAQVPYALTSLPNEHCTEHCTVHWLYIVLYTKLDSLFRWLLREIYSALISSVYSIFSIPITSFGVFVE